MEMLIFAVIIFEIALIPFVVRSLSDLADEYVR